MTDAAPPPPTMTMLHPVGVTNVGAKDVKVVDADGADTTLKPGQSVPADGVPSQPGDK